MSKYNGILCEHCKKPFKDDDDIVVCPECGAPHHRECYNELGHCALSDKHSADFCWQPKYPQNNSGVQGDSVICPNCNSVNLAGSRYCCMCQTPLEGQSSNNGQNYGRYNSFSGNEQQSSNAYAPSPASFSIDSVDSNELTAYTGSSFHYYIRQFKLLLGNRFNISWNWAALVFNFFYFFYRKMYKVAFALLMFHIVNILPVLLCFFGETDASMEMMGITIYYNSQMMQQFAPFSSFFDTIGMFLNIWCALFANKLYLRDAVSKIKRFKDSCVLSRDTQEYYDELYYMGKPSVLMVVVVAGLLLAFYTVCGSFMTYTMP